MNRDPSDSSLYDYSVTFYMQGIQRCFEYEVSRETSQRIRGSLEDEDAGNLVFEACRPAEQIVINSRFVQMVQFRWRPKSAGDGGDGLAAETGDAPSAAGAHNDAILFYFAGRESPLSVLADDPEEVFDLVLAMQTEAFPRCSIVDAAGEETLLDIRRLVCAEFPLGLTHEGEAQALFEVTEEA